MGPGWPDHARHLAVEFVHPVVVGKRALPAVAVTGPDPAPAVRDRSRPGDMVVVIASEPAPELTDLASRAGAWGLATVWIGTVDRPPPPGLADHTLLCEDPAGLHGRQAVLSYHLLWELTHVCLEHPGLLNRPVEEGAVCITCSDEARRGEVVHSEGARALVRSGRGMEQVDVSLVPALTPGDTVLVHAGVAIASMTGASMTPGSR